MFTITKTNGRRTAIGIVWTRACHHFRIGDYVVAAHGRRVVILALAGVDDNHGDYLGCKIIMRSHKGR